jgi:hypothetical protein
MTERVRQRNLYDIAVFIRYTRKIVVPLRLSTSDGDLPMFAPTQYHLFRKRTAITPFLETT